MEGDLAIQEDRFRAFFEQFGEIEDLVVMKDKGTGQSRGFGINESHCFVSFKDRVSVTRVMNQPLELEGRKLEASLAQLRESSTGASGSGPTTSKKLFVGGIPFTLTAAELKNYFAAFGRIVDGVIMEERETKRSRGFGFITFENQEDCDRVFAMDHKIGDKSVDLRRAENKFQSRSAGGTSGAPNHPFRESDVEVAKLGRKLFVGGIPFTLTSEGLRAYFATFGAVNDAIIMEDKETKRSRGFGFVTMESPEIAESVFAHPGGHKIEGKQVELRRAESKTRSDEMSSSTRGHHRMRKTETPPPRFGGGHSSGGPPSRYPPPYGSDPYGYGGGGYPPAFPPPVDFRYPPAPYPGFDSRMPPPRYAPPPMNAPPAFDPRYDPYFAQRAGGSPSASASSSAPGADQYSGQSRSMPAVDPYAAQRGAQTQSPVDPYAAQRGAQAQPQAPVDPYASYRQTPASPPVPPTAPAPEDPGLAAYYASYYQALGSAYATQAAPGVSPSPQSNYAPQRGGEAPSYHPYAR